MGDFFAAFWRLGADQAFVTADGWKRQLAEARRRGRVDPLRYPLYVPPLIIIESISPGHERHDEVTKRGWYAPFGVTHYWLLNAYTTTLNRLVLEGGSYREDAAGSGDEAVQPAAFAGLSIPLGELWLDEA